MSERNDHEKPSAAIERRCAKCGSDDIRVAWHDKGSYSETRKVGFSQERCYSDYGPTGGKPKGEHLHYKCRCCGFDWTGDVLNADA